MGMVTELREVFFTCDACGMRISEFLRPHEAPSTRCEECVAVDQDIREMVYEDALADGEPWAIAAYEYNHPEAADG